MLFLLSLYLSAGYKLGRTDTSFPQRLPNMKYEWYLGPALVEDAPPSPRTHTRTALMPLQKVSPSISNKSGTGRNCILQSISMAMRT